MNRFKQARIKLAGEQFETARIIAEAIGRKLIKNNEVHYSLVVGDHKFELYPSNHHVWKKWRGLPFLKVHDGWTLLGAIRGEIVDRDLEADNAALDANREMGIDESLIDGDWGSK